MMMLMIGKPLNWPRVQIYFSTLCHNRHSVVLHRIVWHCVVLHRILSSVIIQHADGGLHLPSNTALSVLKIHFRTLVNTDPNQFHSCQGQAGATD